MVVQPVQQIRKESAPGSGITKNDFIFPIFMMTEVPHVLKGLGSGAFGDMAAGRTQVPSTRS